MNSKRHSRLRRHQLYGTPRNIRRLQRRIADLAAAEVCRVFVPRLLQMFSGEVRGGVVSPGSLKFDRAKFMEISAEAVTGPKPFGVLVDELHKIS